MQFAIEQSQASGTVRQFGRSQFLKAVMVVWIPAAMFMLFSGRRELDSLTLFMVPGFWAMAIFLHWPRKI